MADQVIRNWTRKEAVSGGALVKVTPFKPCTILIGGTGTCDIVAYLVSDSGDGPQPTARNKYIIMTGATDNEAYTANSGFAEIGVENVSGEINLEVIRA